MAPCGGPLSVAAARGPRVTANDLGEHAALARRRYPELSERLGLLLARRDVDFGLIGAAPKPTDEEPDVVGSALCPIDAAVGQRAARAFADFFDDSDDVHKYDAFDETHRTVQGPSLWYVKQGALWQGRLIAQQARFAGQLLARRGSLLLRKGRRFRRFVLRAHFARHAGRPVRSHALAFCVQDLDNYYLLIHEPQGGPPPQPVRLLKVCGDVFQQLAAVDGPAVMEGGIDVEVSRAWDSLRIAYGPCLLSVEDGAHRGGSVGLLAYDNDSLCVDSLACRPWRPPHVGHGVRAAAALADLRDVLPEWRVLFEDRFTEPLGDAAEVFDAPGCIFGPSQWERGGGLLRQHSNIHRTNDYDRDSIEERGSLLVFRAVIECRRARYRMHVGGADGAGWDGFGFVFHFQDEENYYLLREDPRFQILRLLRVLRGEWTLLAAVDTDGSQPVAGQAVEVRVDRLWRNNTEHAQRITAQVGRLPSLRAVDNTFQGIGRCGFMVFAEPHFCANYLQVLDLSLGGDAPRHSAPVSADPERPRAATAPARPRPSCGAPCGGRGRLLAMLQEQHSVLLDVQHQSEEFRAARSGALCSRKVAQGRPSESAAQLATRTAVARAPGGRRAA